MTGRLPVAGHQAPATLPEGEENWFLAPGIHFRCSKTRLSHRFITSYTPPATNLSDATPASSRHLLSPTPPPRNWHLFQIQQNLDSRTDSLSPITSTWQQEPRTFYSISLKNLPHRIWSRKSALRSIESQMKNALPTMWSSGTNPQ